MDIKTLEYMEERAKKAREIVNKIEGLVEKANRLDQTYHIQFSDQYSNKLCSISGHSHLDDHKRLISKIRPALHQLIADEIAQLEAELAEL